LGRKLFKREQRDQASSSSSKEKSQRRAEEKETRRGALGQEGRVIQNDVVVVWADRDLPKGSENKGRAEDGRNVPGVSLRGEGKQSSKGRTTEGRTVPKEEVLTKRQ